MSPAAITLTRLHSSAEARPYADAIAGIDRATAIEDWGHSDLAISPQQLLGHLSHQRYLREVVVVAQDHAGEEPLGFFRLCLPRTAQKDLAELDLLVVHPAARRRGIGSALLKEAERVAAEEGRSLFVASSAHPREPARGEDALEPPTGSGRIPAADPAVCFARHHGYRLEQVERHSLLRLPAAPGKAARFEAEAQAAAGAEYRVHVWQGAVPPAWRGGIAALAARMSTDVPSGDVDFGQAHWDADRVAYWHEREVAQGMDQLTAAAEHQPSGTLAGYTTLMRSSCAPQAAIQDDTLVAPEHRGHRLGMLVKAANLRQLADRWPDARRLHTWNAEENGFMLAINVALGFVPDGAYALWRRS